MENSKPEGVGSIWNINSWHWETKNYTPIAKELIQKRMQEFIIQEGNINIVTKRVSQIEGEAQINIRKGKQIMCYEFTIDVEWFAENDVAEAAGKYQIIDINESDLDFTILNVTTDYESEINDQVKEILRKKLKQSLTDKIFGTFTEDLAKFESDPQKIQQDKEKRELVQKEIEKARLEKGKLKEQIFQEQLEKDKAMKYQLNFKK